MNIMASFVKECIALLKGDDAEAKAQKILRAADSAFKTQIASLTGDTIALEDKVENAKEELRLAKLNNGELISDRNNYISALLRAKNTLTDAEEALELHTSKLDFLVEEHLGLEDKK